MTERDDLPSDGHIVRYVSPILIRDNGKVAGSAFCLRAANQGETSLSVN